MAISKELQIGKAGEHFVCYNLIKQGYNAFLADAGLNYDVLVDIGGKLLRVQVKSAQQTINTKKSEDIYRFAIKYGKYRHCIYNNEADIFAFVALDINTVGYLSKTELINSQSNRLKQCVEFFTKTKPYIYQRVYSSGIVREKYGKFIEDFSFDKLTTRCKNEFDFIKLKN